MTRTNRVAIIGAGLMGHGVAQIFASQGYYVQLLDLDHDLLKKALINIRSNLGLLAAKGVISEIDIDTALERINITTDLKEAAYEASFILEAVVEKLEVKQQIFKKLDQICPDRTILATNTSVISITKIASRAKRRGRIVGTHFWNPPYLIPLVEVIPGDDTDPSVVDSTCTLMEQIGKKPARIKMDVPGFVGNRLQHALWREAISIVEKGIADAAEVDEVVKNSFGLRLPVLGPLENADMVGLDLTYNIHEYILKFLEDSHSPSPLLMHKIDSGDLGFKTGQGLQKWPRQKRESLRSRLLQHLIKSKVGE